MTWRFRRSRTFGPLRLVLSKAVWARRSASVRSGTSLGADGNVRRTRRLPGTSVYDVEEVMWEEGDE
jgi:hypothetical protein